MSALDLRRSFRTRLPATVKDDRTDEQKRTHILAVVAADRFMSGWGGASHGASRCAWAFDPSKANSDRVFNWVKARREMRFVNLFDMRTYRAPRGTAHFHVYTCNADHIAARF